MQEPGPILTDKIIGLGIKVHRSLGPGLLESVYADCLTHELRKAGLRVQREVRIGLVYDGMTFEKSFIADAIVGDEVLLELKSVENLLPDLLDCGSRAVGQAFCLRRPLRPPCSRLFIIFGGPQP